MSRSDAELPIGVLDSEHRSGHSARMPRWPRRPLVALVVGLLVALIGVPVVGIGYAVLRNNHEMSEWRSRFYDASTIEGAEVIDKGSRFGLQPGTNGDHCDREAWLVYRTDLEPHVVRAHFGQLLDPADGELFAARGPEPGTVRVDYWYRFDDGGWDVRCS